MSNIKVGEWIRTDIGNILKYEGKVKEFVDEYLSLSNKKSIEFLGKITKHSHNIIDLIEIGDYVNGYKVDEKLHGVLVHKARGIDRSGFEIPIAQYNDDIKSVLTKEQFKQREFIVKE